MNTNIKIELDEDQRRQISRHMFGSNKEVTRKELNILVNTFVEHMIDPGPAPEDHPDNPVARVTASEIQGGRDRTRSGAKPAKPNDASYMRGWNAVGQIVRRMR